MGLHPQTNARITFGPTADENPAWSPDGKQLAFSSDRDGFFQLYRKDASGAGEEERLTNEPKRHQDPLHWSPDGRYLVYRQLNPGTGWDLMLLPLQGDRKPIVLLQTPESDSDARFSPDGRWIAYHSRLNGRSVEVYVQGFSGDGKVGLTGTRLQISDGGAGPLWGSGRPRGVLPESTDHADAPNIMGVSVTSVAAAAGEHAAPAVQRGYP